MVATTPAPGGEPAPRTLTIERPARPARAIALPWRVIWVQAVVVWLAARVAYALALGVFLPLFVGDGLLSGVPFGLPAHATRATSVTPQALLAAFNRWDAANFYVPIATQGYTRPIDAAFWPLYPALIHVATVFTGPQRALLDALVIGNLGALLACVGVAALVAQLAQERGVFASALAQRRALAALGASPFAFWLVMPYTDGLFLGLIALGLVALRRRAWLAVALCAALAALTRPTALAFELAIAFELGSLAVGAGLPRVWRRAWRPLLAPALALAAAPLATLAWLRYCAWRLGDMWAPLTAERTGFGHNATSATSGPVTAARLMLADLSAPSATPLSWTQIRLWLDLAPTLATLALLLLALMAWASQRRAWVSLTPALPTSLLLFVVVVWLLAIAEPVSGTIVPDPLLSSGRYLLAAAPLYSVWADICRRWPWLEQVSWQVGAPLQMALALYVFNGGWLV